jgi:3-dehydroquinate synthase
MQELIFGQAAPEAVAEVLLRTPHSQVVLLADQRVLTYHPDRLTHLFEHVHLIEASEEHKTLSAVQEVYMFLQNIAADRHTLAVVLGGGLTLDMAGFACATWKRGIRYTTVPTTLLAMVDASIGGKTGVNLLGIKNTIGAFHDPLATVFDPVFLETLPERQTLAGFAEVLKHGLVLDATYWNTVSNTALADQDWPAVIARSVKLKRKIVALDPTELGPRATLNFGHTVGHALESASHAQLQPLHHGEAVALGMLAETWLSVEFAGLPASVATTIQQRLKQYPYPWDYHLSDPARILHYLHHDKKNRNGEVRMALLNSIGKCKHDVPVPTEAALGVLQSLLSVAV